MGFDLIYLLAYLFVWCLFDFCFGSLFFLWFWLLSNCIVCWLIVLFEHRRCRIVVFTIELNYVWFGVWCLFWRFDSICDCLCLFSCLIDWRFEWLIIECVLFCVYWIICVWMEWMERGLFVLVCALVACGLFSWLFVCCCGDVCSYGVDVFGLLFWVVLWVR